MPTEDDQTTVLHPVNGFAFVRAVLDHRGDDAVETLLAAAHGGETDWLEKKAAVYPSPEHDPAFQAKTAKCPPEKLAEETRFYETEILRTIVAAVVALHNSRGGVVFVGIDDANDPVPFETCDPAGILEKRGLEAYVREAVLGRLFPKNGEFRCKRETWIVPAKDIGVTTKLLPYRGTTVLALLVPSLKAGRPPVLVTKTENNRSRNLLLQRESGDVGAVATRIVESTWSDNAANLSDFHGERGERFLSNTDLSGNLRTLGIPLPPPEPDNSGIPWSRRSAFRLFVFAIVVLILTCSAILAIRRIEKPAKTGSFETQSESSQSEQEPLDATRTSEPTVSDEDRRAIETFISANFAMTQGGDFLAFYNAFPAAWRKALDESVPALVSKCPDTEYMLFREAALTFYRSYGLHAEWRAETYNTQNLKNGYVKEEVRDAGRRYAAGALAIAEAATADRLLEGNLPALLALPPAGLPGGIGVPPPYTPAKMDFRAEPKPDGSVIVTPSAHPDSVFRMVRVDGVWVSEYWAKCFEGCETWKTRIENVRMTPVRRRWLLKNLIVLKGIAKAGEDASNQSVGLWADSWAVSALKMCRTTFFGDSFRLADWSRVYEFHRLHAAYPKLSPTYGEPEEIDLLDENPAALTTNMYFHPDAESERKTNEAAERERLKRIAETPDEPPPERDSEADAETIGRALLDMPVTNAPAGKN